MTSELGNSGPTSNATEPVRRVGPDGAGFERLAGALRDRYHIVREIGRGGAAYVYLAIDLRSNENIALKVLRPEFSVAVGEARFQREIEIASELRHPNVLSLLDFGTADGRLYFTMPFVEGESLSIRIRRDRQMRLHDAIVIARDVAKALDYAHERGVIHRDIKPANILLSAKGIHVADFGIARAMRVVTGEEITDSGVVVGTPEYMSPEQATAAKGLDGRSDVYALGCVAYEMIAGEPPFTGPSAQAVLARHCHEKPRSIRIIRPAIPLGVERAIEQALAKVPADRFETAGAFIDALEAGTDARTDVFGLTRLTRRTRRLVGGTLILLAAAVAWTVFHMRPPALDRSRIVVFPLYEASTVGGSEAGEQVATLIGYALDGTRPLKWLDGWDLFDSAQRNSGNRLDARRARQISERVGAGFYLDGSILRQLDSVTVLLQLFSVLGDSVVRRVGVSGPATASLPHLGLEALRRMLPDLVAPGGTIDVSALTDRRLPAVLNFLQGER